MERRCKHQKYLVKPYWIALIELKSERRPDSLPVPVWISRWVIRTTKNNPINPKLD